MAGRRLHLLRTLDRLYHATKDSAFARAGSCPAYGVRFADHTAFSRIVSRPRSRRPGVRRRGERHDGAVAPAGDGRVLERPRRFFTTIGRKRILDGGPLAARPHAAHGPRRIGFYRHSTDLDPKSGVVGGAFGFAPTSRLTVWTRGRCQPAGRRTRRHVVGGRERNVVRGLPGTLAEVLAADEDVRRRARLLGAPAAGVRGRPAAAHALERRRCRTITTTTTRSKSTRPRCWCSCICICEAGR